MISLCVPSRGRPERAKMMRESAMDTAKDKDNLEIVWYLNEDDKSLSKYQSYFWPNVKIGPHQSTCMSWNQCAERATQPIVALMGDDVLFKSKHWDLEIKKEFDKASDPMLMVVPYTGRPRNYSEKQKAAKERYVVPVNEKINAPHYAVSREWVKYFGYLCSPMFWHFYVDTYTQILASRVGRCVYRPDIVWRTKKLDDSTTQEVRDHLNIRERDTWVWNNCARQLDADVEYLKRYIKKQC